MKHFIFISLLLISVSSALAQSGYINKDPKAYIGKTFRVDTLLKEEQETGYNYFTSDIGVESYKRIPFKANGGFKSPYKILVNKVFKCVDAGDDIKIGHEYLYLKLSNTELGTMFYCYKPSPGMRSLYDLVNVDEENKISVSLDSLNSLYTGKKLWLKDNHFSTIDIQRKSYEGKVTNPNFLFAPVTVLAVTRSNDPYSNVFRVLFTTPLTKNAGFFDFDERKVPLYVYENPYISSSSYTRSYHLSDLIYLIDPKITYHLTPAELLAIKKKEISFGMRKDVVMLIMGKPQKINRTTNAYAVDEQWVYANSYYYFTNGRLTSVQD